METIYVDSALNKLDRLEDGKIKRYFKGGFRIGLVHNDVKKQIINTKAESSSSGECYAVLCAIRYAAKNNLKNIQIVSDCVQHLYYCLHGQGGGFLTEARKVAKENNISTVFKHVYDEDNLADSVATSVPEIYNGDYTNEVYGDSEEIAINGKVSRKELYTIFNGVVPPIIDAANFWGLDAMKELNFSGAFSHKAFKNAYSPWKEKKIKEGLAELNCTPAKIDRQDAKPELVRVFRKKFGRHGEKALISAINSLGETTAKIKVEEILAMPLSRSQHILELTNTVKQANLDNWSKTN